MTVRLIAATALLATGLAAPAAAEPVLEPLKPCYASDGSGPKQRETIQVRATGFTPEATLSLFIDGMPVAAGQADAFGVAAATVPAPFHSRGERPFTLFIAERENTRNTVAATTLVTNLTVTLRPNRARPSRRVRFRGRGFTKDAPVYGHYLYGGELVRTVRLARRPTGACGVFSVKRRQIPVRRPRTGEWILQVDQQKTYAERPASNMQQIIITVRETFRDPD